MTAHTPNEQTFETMDAAVKSAARWDLGISTRESVAWLCRWVRLRMSAYTTGGWSGEQEDMVEWIAIDLALDEPDARRLCDEAGWPREPTLTAAPCCAGEPRS